MPKNIFITGANGFIGRALCRRCISEKWNVWGTVRSPSKISHIPKEIKIIQPFDIERESDWTHSLEKMDVLIHLAARVHMMKDTAADPLHQFRRLNTEGTKNLARMAADSGVKRFIYISSIKVNGQGSSAPYTEKDRPEPQDPYGISKWEAEQILQKISSETGMEIIIIRPPLVYGPGVRANFLRLLRLVEWGIPLPFADVDNLRSLIFLENLVDAIAACVRCPSIGNQTFLVSDNRGCSTAALIRHMAAAMGRHARLFSLPPSALALSMSIMGKKDLYDRLCGSLTVDTNAISKTLSWQPPFSLEEGIADTVEWYLRNK